MVFIIRWHAYTQHAKPRSLADMNGHSIRCQGSFPQQRCNPFRGKLACQRIGMQACQRVACKRIMGHRLRFVQRPIVYPNTTRLSHSQAMAGLSTPSISTEMA